MSILKNDKIRSFLITFGSNILTDFLIGFLGGILGLIQTGNITTASLYAVVVAALNATVRFAVKEGIIKLEQIKSKPNVVTRTETENSEKPDNVLSA